MTVDELQHKVDEVDRKFNFNWPMYVRFVHLVEEVGELGEALTVHQKDRKSGSGTSALADHANIEEELGDVLFALFDLANKLNINLIEAMNKTFLRYDKKLINAKRNK